MSHKHLIGRQRFRLQTEGRDQAKAISSRVSDLLQNRLTHHFDELFSEFSLEEEIIRIDTLRLDIGEISPDNLEAEVTERVIKQLRERLQEIFAEQATDTTRISKPVADFELLTFFLLRGYLPWQADQDSMHSPSELLSAVLKNSPKRLFSFLREVYSKLFVFTRLQLQFSADSLRAVNESFFLKGWPSVAEDIKFLLALQGLKPLPSNRGSALTEQLFLATATRLIVNNQGSPATATEWPVLLLLEIAALRQIPATELIAHFSQAAADMTTAQRKQWPAEQMTRITTSLTDNDLVLPIDHPAESAKRLQAMVTFLKKGTLPSAGAFRTAGAMEALLRLWLANDPVGFQPVFRRMLEGKALRNRVHQTLSGPTLIATHQWLWGTYWPSVSAYLSDLEQFMRQVGLPAFSEDYLRRTVLSDWLGARLAGPEVATALPAGSSTNSSPTPVQQFWIAQLTSSLQTLARESGRPFNDLIQDLVALSTKSETVWESDLPTLLASVEVPGDQAVFGKELPAKAVAVFRFFLERGFLPEGFAKDGMASLEEDIYQRALSGSSTLFEMLATVIPEEAAFARFRRDVAPQVLYALAAQLVSTRENEATPFRQPGAQEAASLPASKKVAGVSQDTPSQPTPPGRTIDNTADFPINPPEPSALVVAPEDPLSSTSTKDQTPDTPVEHTGISNPEQTPNTQIGHTADSTSEPAPDNPVEHTGASNQEQVPDTPVEHIPASPSEQISLTNDSALLEGQHISNIDPEAVLPPLGADVSSLPQQEATDVEAPSTKEELIGETDFPSDAAAAGQLPHPASNPSLHPRPRPDLPSEERKQITPASPWALLFDHLAALYPNEPTWPLDQAIYLRYSHSFFIRQQLKAGEKNALTLPALVKEWAEMIALAAEQPWPVMAVYLAKAATSITTLPEALRNALLQAAGLSPDAPLPVAAPAGTTETASAHQPTQAETTASEAAAAVNKIAQAWADWITQTDATLPNQATLLTSSVFDRLIAEVSEERTAFIALIADKKILPDRLLDRIAFSKVRTLINLLIADLPDGTTNWMAALEWLLMQGEVYDKKEDARQQLNRYALLRLLGTAAAPRRLDTFTEQLLAMVAREHGQTTIELVKGLMLHHKASKIPPTMRRILQRIVARIPPEAIKKIQQDTLRDQKAIAPLSANERKGRLQRAALAHYLEKGESPWWSSTAGRPDQLFAQAVEVDVTAVLGMLAGAPALADKLFPFLPEPTIRGFVAGVFPAYADFLFAWAECIQSLQKQAVLPTRDGLRLAWFPVWDYVLSAKTFSSVGFVKTALRAVAKASKTDRVTLLRLLTGEVDVMVRRGGARYSRLAVILAEESLVREDTSLSPGTEGDAKDAEKGADHERSASEGAAAGAGERIKGAKEEAEVSATSYADELATDLSRLRHFFYYGTPLAGQPSISRSAFEELQQRIIRLHPEIATTLYRAVLSDRIARNRLVRFFPLVLWQDILHLLLGHQMQRVERLWADLSLLLPDVLPQFKSAAFRKDAVIALLAYAPIHSGNPDLTTYPEYLLEGPASRGGTTLAALFNELQTILQQPPAGLRENWTQVLAGIKQRKITAATAATDEKNTHSMEESMYIHNSGLVILAAYFKRYFGMLDMLDGTTFRNEEDAVRGVLLLEYLASGRTEVEEHELVFNKMLCGLDVATPVPTTLELTEQEVEVSDQMLNAILQNWDKMSNSTVENLRGSFLLREGLLKEHDGHWSLQVSSAGYDILLSFLPWTISVISLPWVDKRLEVEWNTHTSA